MTLEALVLQHVGCETPEAYEEVLLRRGAHITRVQVDEGQPLPDWRDATVIVAMGGPMSVTDAPRLPWMHDELDAIRSAVRAGRPFWGVCLGAQLLAAALGAPVYPGPRPEVGVYDIELTQAGRTDPVTRSMPTPTAVFHWHSDTFDLPPGGVRLASSSAYANQMFRWGSAAYGLQFHAEAGAQAVARWLELPEYRSSLAHARGDLPWPRLAAEIERAERDMRIVAEHLFEAWLDRIPALSPLARGQVSA